MSASSFSCLCWPNLRTPVACCPVACCMRFVFHTLCSIFLARPSFRPPGLMLACAITAERTRPNRPRATLAQPQDCAAFDWTSQGTGGLPIRFVNRKAEALSAISAMLETITDVTAFTVPSHAVVGRFQCGMRWDTMPCGLPCRVGYHAVRDTMPGGIPCRMGYHAGWDTMPDGIPCRVGCHVGWDAMSGGMPRRLGYLRLSE
jgi:hypothetical protein